MFRDLAAGCCFSNLDHRIRIPGEELSSALIIHVPEPMCQSGETGTVAPMELRVHGVVNQILFTSKLNDMAVVCDGDTHYEQLVVFKWLYWIS